MAKSKKEQEQMASKVKETYEADSSTVSDEEKAVDVEQEASESGEKAEEVVIDIDPSDSKKLMEALSETTVALEEEKQKSAELQAKFVRSVADLENYRKRAVKDREDLSRRAVIRVIEDLLPIVDNFKLGMEAADNQPEAKDVVAGFKMVYDQILEMFKTHGVEEIHPDGEAFDPQFHECVSHLPHEEIEENLVIQTIRCGYRLHDRLIRAATVVVSSGKAES
ncbi:MAG: nucleotide exchange factor GrpE [Opitutales bacterium]|nr:nucleotide exchange factor GrpE [Opitutales bacterium]